MAGSPQTLPLFVRLAGRAVLVAGGGRVATRRVRRLLRVGANVTVVSITATGAIERWARAGQIRRLETAIEQADIGHYSLIIAATDDPAANADLARRARAAGIWVARTDDAQDSDIVMPAIVDRWPLQIAIASDGRAPTLSRRLQARLEAWVPRAYGDLAQLADQARAAVAGRLPQHRRARFWTDVFEGPTAEHVFAGHLDAARRVLDEQLTRAVADDAPTGGEVYLVGCGPGDPDLLTFRALRLMQRAEVVLYDSLVPASIIELAAPEAERIHVGKRAERHTIAQADLNQLMAERAAGGQRVLRLKGGDPFIFGRGGEEIAELAARGVSFQVVPGVTAAAGCAAYAGIPLTHRDHAQAVIFATGHLQNGELDLAWNELARPGQTLVLFMARRNLHTICQQLRAHGLADDHPLALIVDGTTTDQKVYVSTLETWSEFDAIPRDAGPAIAIVGSVVTLHAALDWFQPSAARPR